MEQEILDNIYKYLSVFASVLIIIYAYTIVRRKRKADKRDDAIFTRDNSDTTGDLATRKISASKEATAWLIIKTSHKGILTYPLKSGRNDIGRDPPAKNNSIQIVGENGPDFYMSKYHFTILVLKGKTGNFQYFIYDVMSTNGTYVNERKIGKKMREISDNSIIKAGKTDMIFRTNISNSELGQYLKEN